jgi:hypothetical protein
VSARALNLKLTFHAHIVLCRGEERSKSLHDLDEGVRTIIDTCQSQLAAYEIPTKGSRCAPWTNSAFGVRSSEVTCVRTTRETSMLTCS